MKLVTVGCSFTAGLGVDREKNYTSVLSTLLNFEYDNWGAAGHSNQYIFRKTIQLLENFNEDDILIVQWTNPNRDEIITNEGYLFFPPFSDWCSLEFLYGRNPQPGLEKVGIFNKDEFEKDIIKKKKTLVDNYSTNFYNNDYQKELSFCFQYSLYGLLKSKNIKFLMFFGWDFETKKEILALTDNNFLNENFGKFTNTPGMEHPNEEGHKNWAEYLYKKIKEFNYI